jgi:hypothetical protein
MSDREAGTGAFRPGLLDLFGLWEAAMALSARDRRIITAIEHELAERDPPWTRRFTRRCRGFERLERRRLHPGRRCALGTCLVITWVVLLCVAAHGPAACLWAALGASLLVLTLVGGRAMDRRRRYGRWRHRP